MRLWVDLGDISTDTVSSPEYPLMRDLYPGMRRGKELPTATTVGRRLCLPFALHCFFPSNEAARELLACADGPYTVERAGGLTGLSFCLTREWRAPRKHIILLQRLGIWRCVGLHLSEDIDCVWYDSEYGCEFQFASEQLPDMERWIMARVLDGEVRAERPHPCIRIALGGKMGGTPATEPRGRPRRYESCDVPTKRIKLALSPDTPYVVSNGACPEGQQSRCNDAC